MSDVLRLKCPAISPEFSSNFREKHAGDEGLCFDRPLQQAILPARHFCKIFEIEATIGCVVQRHPSSGSSPSRAFFDNPSLNCSFAVYSVFRIMRVNLDYTAEFSTGWVASPGILCDEDRYLFFAICAAHTFEDPENADYYKGCFGVAAKPKNFRNCGFIIEKDPVFYAKEEGADLAIIQFYVEATEMCRVIPKNVKFLLPCSSVEYGNVGAHVAAFGFNGFDWFSEQAKAELLEGQSSRINLWNLYKEMFQTPQHLYRVIQQTVNEFKTGAICCSPSTVVHLDGDYGKLRSSTLEGCSGAPLMPNSVEGVVCYVHRGREPSSSGYDLLNRATGLDHRGFVESYSEYILKLIPAKMDGRNAIPFQKWCALHHLAYPVEQASSVSYEPKIP